MTHISIEHAAQMMAVSSATLRNWAKTGHIQPVSVRPILFSTDSILHLKTQLDSKSFGRLQTRANKSGAVSHFVPPEYVDNAGLMSHITALVTLVQTEGLPTDVVIFLAALRLLERQGEVHKKPDADPFSMDSYDAWYRPSVQSCMTEWRVSMPVSKSDARYARAYDLIHPDDNHDFLGLLYQSLLMEGHKSDQGSYYTPSKLVDDALSHLDPSVHVFLDPCCGSGQFLLKAAKKFKLKPNNIYGFDCDPIALQIARVNLLITYKEIDFIPHLFCIDALTQLATGEMFCETNHLLNTVDAIATNPPWGAYKNAIAKTAWSQFVKSGETFSLFLEKSIQLLIGLTQIIK